MGKAMRRLGVSAMLAAVSVVQTAAAGDAVVVYPAAEAFEEVVESIKMAITERGLLVSGTLHVAEMLERTGKDLGYEQPVYARAESVEFCSAAISHRMIAVDARNLVICPFTVAAYSLAVEPDQVYVAYRRPALAGVEAEKTTAVVEELLDGIARQAAE